MVSARFSVNLVEN